MCLKVIKQSSNVGLKGLHEQKTILIKRIFVKHFFFVFVPINLEHIHLYLFGKMWNRSRCPAVHFRSGIQDKLEMGIPFPVSVSHREATLGEISQPNSELRPFLARQSTSHILLLVLIKSIKINLHMLTIKSALNGHDFLLQRVLFFK